MSVAHSLIPMCCSEALCLTVCTTFLWSFHMSFHSENCIAYRKIVHKMTKNEFKIHWFGSLSVNRYAVKMYIYSLDC